MKFRFRVRAAVSLLVTTLLGPAACGIALGENHTLSGAMPSPEQIEPRGEDLKNGVFDVSVAYGSDGIGWLAYSRAEVPKFIETHIATSTDHGNTWSYVTSANRSVEGNFSGEGGNESGVWRFETPSLRYDPSDQPDRRWKLFTNHYFTAKPFKPVDRRLGSGTIAVQYAATPAGPWSNPVCLVGRHDQCTVDFTRLDPSLATSRFVTEPTAIADGNTLYLALDTGSSPSGLGEWENYRVILLASPDHGRSWRYLGTLLNHDDASRFGYLVFTGTSLVREAGKLYVLATPSGGLKKKNQGHDGVMVVPIEDIAHARVARDESGAPQVVRRIDITKNTGGLADYDEQNTAGGIMMSQISLWGFPKIFQIWKTGATIK